MRHALWILVVLLLFFLVGCGGGQDPLLLSLDEFFSYVHEGDYGSAYNSLTSTAKEKVEMVDFVTKYQNIYSNIDVVAVRAEFESPSPGEDSYIVPVTIALDSAVGVVSWQVSLLPSIETRKL